MRHRSKFRNGNVLATSRRCGGDWLGAWGGRRTASGSRLLRGRGILLRLLRIEIRIIHSVVSSKDGTNTNIHNWLWLRASRGMVVALVRRRIRRQHHWLMVGVVRWVSLVKLLQKRRLLVVLVRNALLVVRRQCGRHRALRRLKCGSLTLSSFK